MSRFVQLGALLGAACVFVGGCGASHPRAEDVFHDPSLRRTTTAPGGEAEQTLLSRLPHPTPGEPIAIEGGVFTTDSVYEAASGRLCQPVHYGNGPARLACETDDGAWAFVPAVFGGDDPFAQAPVTSVE